MEEYCRVLIIDDELIMRQGIKHMVDWEKEGFRIVGEASDGKEGLVLVEKYKPHIVLADILMPVMDGLEFAVRLQEEHPEILLIMLSSYDKFEYVKTALLNGASDYILKPMLSAKGLLETMRQAAAKIPDTKFCSQGETSCETQLTRYMGGYQNQLGTELFEERLPYQLYRVLAVNLKTLSGEKIETIRKKNEKFFRKHTDIAMVSALLDEAVLCMILNYRPKDETHCKDIVFDFADKMKNDYAKSFLVLSREYTDFEDTRAIFREGGVQKVLSMRFYFPGKSLVVLEEKPIRKGQERFEYETYSRYLDDLELDQAASMFMVYIEGLARIYEDEYKIKNLAKNLLFNYFVALERLGKVEEDIRDRCFLEIDRTEDVEAFFAVIRKYVPSQAVDQEKNYDLSYIHIEKMKEYIRNHYREDLKLMDLARQFGFSYCYISTYFKENMPEGFSGYLNKIRIGKARSMLLHTTKSIAEVGSEVGYTDQSYFCRVFKKTTGVTPGRYRRNNGGTKQ